MARWLRTSLGGHRSPRHDAPYRRVASGSGALHRPVLLNLETSDGSGQACHPDVVFIPQGFGAKKWPYWMVCTPYPYKDNRVENPEIFVSHDGVFWSVPDGTRNSLVPSPKNAGDHNSDPDMIFHQDQLWLFYRETQKSRQPTVLPDTNILYLITSSNGIDWSPPVEVQRENAGRQLLSPAVLHNGRHFLMWTVDLDGGELKLARRTSSDGISWSAPETGNVMGLDAARQPWHIDVIGETDGFSAVLVSCTGLGGAGTRIHYARSNDGLNWSTSGFLLEQIYEFEANLQYRASLCKVPGKSSEYEMWYSASSLTNVFSIAYLRLFRDRDRLIPLLPERSSQFESNNESDWLVESNSSN